MTTITYPAAPLALPPPPAPVAARRSRVPPSPGDWKYCTVGGRAGTLAMGLFIAALVHVVFLYGFNRKPARAAAVVDEAPVIQMAMPEILEEEEEKPVELTDDLEPPAGMTVPTLAEYITAVPVDAFVQPMSFTPPSSGDLLGAKLSTVPIHMTRGTGKVSSLGEIFKLSDLDKQPTAVFQPAPPYPYELKRTGVEGTVNVEFIVDAQGEVVHARVVSSTHTGFEEAAIVGVLKWKFRPGIKAGRKVNSRMLVPIRFTITDE